MLGPQDTEAHGQARRGLSPTSSERLELQGGSTT